MKKFLNTAFLSITTIFGLGSSVAAQQYANPVGMRYVGSQQYTGTNTTVVNPNLQRTQYVAPQINSVYAQPMNRVSEIPLYGKNKSVYFYGQKKQDEGILSGSGLYMFADFTTGKTNTGINLEHGEVDNGEADANDDMGTANGFSLGIGRVMSNSLSVEFMYSSYNGMKYGDWVKFAEEEEQEVESGDGGDEADDSEGDDSDTETITVKTVNENTYEVTNGGNITSQFIGFGFKYNLENMFGTLLGRLKPYFGFQLGIAQNTIKDFTVSDEDGYTGDDYLPDPSDDDDIEYIQGLSCTADDPCIAEEYSNGTLNFIGDTTRSFAGGLEAGFSVELEGNLSIDIFYKYNHYGKVKTSGNILSSYDLDETEFYVADSDDAEFDPDNPCADGYSGSYDGEATYIVCSADTNTTEGIQSLTQRRIQSGDMNLRQYGIRLKYMF
ncbi:MAG: hypothetical protein IJ638_00810 [Alphaproteobacteria bacterium]|nr:hypothetical protein [Alphaproteobacteria bacterium]